MLAQNYPCVHLSAGELLRQAAAENSTSPHQQLIADCLVSGNIVPVEISLSLLQAAMQEASLTRGKSLIFLIDGFPRNFDNLQGWIQCMSLPQIASVYGVLYYTCPLRELERRILERASQGSGRSDDNIQSAHKRFKTFEQQTVPVVRTLQRVQDMQLQACSGSKTVGGASNKVLTLQVATLAGDQSLEDVWRDTQQVMNGWIAHDVWTANARLLQAIQERNVTAYRELAVYSSEDDGDDDKTNAMNRHEIDGSVAWDIGNPQMEFETGTKVIVSYDRRGAEPSVTFRERRVWSHQGVKGWVNVHFYRTPVFSD